MRGISRAEPQGSGDPAASYGGEREGRAGRFAHTDGDAGGEQAGLVGCEAEGGRGRIEAQNTVYGTRRTAQRDQCNLDLRRKETGQGGDHNRAGLADRLGHGRGYQRP